MKYPNDEMLKIQFFELESVAAANERYPEEDNLLRDLPEKAAPTEEAVLVERTVSCTVPDRRVGLKQHLRTL